MAERITPDGVDFKGRWRFVWVAGLIPWITYKRNPFYLAFLRRYEWVSEYVQGKDVLDIPCGMGWGTSMIRGAKHITAVDISEDAISEARRRYPSVANFEVGSMDNLRGEDCSIDAVACLEGIEHVSPDIAATFIKESHRILRFDGVLLLTSPHTESGAHSGNPFHVKEYSTEEMTTLLSSHFRIEQLEQFKVDKLIVDYFTCSKKRDVP